MASNSRVELNSVDYNIYHTIAWVWVASQYWRNQWATGWPLAKQ